MTVGSMRPGAPMGRSPFRAKQATRVALAVVAALGGLTPAALAQSRAPDSVRTLAAALILRPGDELDIRVWPDSSLSGIFPIEESGVVYLPALGPIQVAGLSLDSLRAELRRRYGQAMRMPVVTITPRFRVSVLGAVQRPGLYQITPAHTLFDVIGLAGGFRNDARDDRVRVVREGEVVELDARRALSTGVALTALQLRSGDQIVVPLRTRLLTLQNVYIVLQSAVFVVTVISLSRN